MRQFQHSIFLFAAWTVLGLFVLAGVSSILFQLPVESSTAILEAPLSNGFGLGTDALGRSMLQLLWKSTAEHLLLGVAVLGLIAGIGIPVGFLSAYKPTVQCTLHLAYLPSILLSIVLWWFYGYYLPFDWMHFAVLAVALSVVWLIVWRVLKSNMNKYIVISISHICLLLMDFLSMMPRILLVFGVLAVIPQGWLAVVSLLGGTGWVGVARLVRAEVLRLNEQGFVESAKAFGAEPLYIMHRHIAPFVWPVLRSALSLAFAATVLSEAALSFLEMGLPPDTFTWGRMLLMGKMNLQAWWLFVIPLLCIFAVTASLQYVAEHWSHLLKHTSSTRELVS